MLVPVWGNIPSDPQNPTTTTTITTITATNQPKKNDCTYMDLAEAVPGLQFAVRVGENTDGLRLVQVTSGHARLQKQPPEVVFSLGLHDDCRRQTK